MGTNGKNKKWVKAKVIQDGIRENLNILLLQLPNNEQGCIYKNRAIYDKGKSDLIGLILKVRFIKISNQLNINEYTCEQEYPENTIIKLKPTGKVHYDHSSKSKSPEVKAYFFKNDDGIEYYIKNSVIFLGEKSMAMINKKEYFSFHMCNHSAKDDYSQFPSPISPYFLEFDEFCTNKRVKELIINSSYPPSIQLEKWINQKNANWIVKLLELTKIIKKDLYESKNFSLLVELYSFEINILNYIQKSGFLYTQSFKNKLNNTFTKKELVQHKQEAIKIQIRSYGYRKNFCEIIVENKLLDFVCEVINNLSDDVATKNDDKVFKAINLMEFCARRVVAESLELNEELMYCYEKYYDIIKGSNFYNSNETKIRIIGPFIDFKKIVRKRLFGRSDVVSNEFAGSPLLKFLILCTEIDFELVKLQENDDKVINFYKILMKSDRDRFRGYYDENSNKTYDLLTEAYEHFKFNDLGTTVQFELPHGEKDEYYKEIYFRCTSLFESLSLLEDNSENKISLLKQSIAFCKLGRLVRGYYLEYLVLYLEFYHKIIEPSNTLGEVLKGVVSYHEKFENMIKKVNKRDLFLTKFPAVVQFGQTYELLMLINKNDSDSLQFIHDIFQKNIESLKSTFSTINNLKLSKLIYANNLLIDVYEGKDSLQQDIYEFVKNGLIDKTKTFGLGVTKKKLINSIMGCLLKGENINFEWKSTLFTETTNYQIMNHKPNKIFANVPALSFLQSTNAFLNSQNGGKLFLGISEDETHKPMIHGIEKDDYNNDDEYTGKINELLKNFIKSSNSKINLQFIKVDAKIAKAFGIDFDPKPKLIQYTERTICEVSIEGYNENPHLTELTYINKDGSQVDEIYTKTIHGKQIMSASDVNRFLSKL